MPEICRFFGIIITMYFDEHNPPHFHARYGEYKMEVAIETLSVLAGKFPPRALGLVTEWAVQHREELLEDWELACKRSELKKISPLE
jgi:phosphomannomutase